MKPLLFLLVVFIGIISFNDEPYNNLLERFEYVIPQEIQHIDKDFLAGAPLHFFSLENDRYILIDGTNWSIFMFDNNGNKITSVGGSGRGPGEFQSINDAFIDDEGLLNVFDARQYRISLFEIDLNEIRLQSTVNLGEPVNRLMLKNILNTDKGMFGVYQQLGSTDYEIHLLNDDFMPSDFMHRFEINDFEDLDAIPLFDRVSYAWNRDWFFFVDNFTLNYFKCDFGAFDCTKVINDIDKRTATAENKQFLYNRFAEFKEFPPFDEIISNLDDLEFLPWSDYTVTTQKYIYTTFFNMSENINLIAQISIDDDSVRFIKFEQEGLMKIATASDNVIYLFEYEESFSENMIRITF